MDHLDTNEITRIKDLLRRTGEFIAYFELAETKMMQWRVDIEDQSTRQYERAEKQLAELKLDLENLQGLLSQAGIARFRLFAESHSEQAKTHLESLQKSGESLTYYFEQQTKQINTLITNAVTQINEASTTAIERLDNHLSGYDAQQFHRIAHESCDKVNTLTHETLKCSHQLLRAFEWRQAVFAIVITLFTTLTVSLYLNDELPWEHHQTASNERKAGQLLLKAWPHLTDNEQTKIMSVHANLST